MTQESSFHVELMQGRGGDGKEVGGSRTITSPGALGGGQTLRADEGQRRAPEVEDEIEIVTLWGVLT